MKLRYLLLVIFGLVAAVPLMLFWAWPHSQSMTNEVEDVRDRNLLIAETLAAALAHYHRDVTASFRLIYSNLLTQGQVEGAEHLLEDLHFRSVCVFDIRSRELRQSVDSFDNRCPEVVAEEDLEFYRSIAADGGAAIAPVRAAADGTPRLHIAAPITANWGDAIAVGALYTDFLTNLGRSTTFGQRGHAVVVDQMGRVLAHPDASWERERRDLSGLRPVQRALQGQAGVAIFPAPFLNGDGIAAFTDVESAGWGVMVVQPVDELREKAAEVSRSALVVVTIGMLAALVIGTIVAFFMTRPLRAVSQAARRMAAGDAEARTPVSKGLLVPEEVRDLQLSFNVMAEATERSKRDEHEARLRAEEANRSKSAFLANMSHELRTPLNAILGFSEVILAETFGKVGTPRYVEYLRDIRVSARHLLDLINDLLDLSRIEAGAVKLNEIWTGLADCLEESASMFREKCAADGLTLQVDNRAGPLNILTD